MMCSDGLSGMIRAEDIRSALLAVSDPLEACKLLTDRANQAGGHDNITVIVVHFEGPGLSDVSSSDEPVKYRKYALPHAPSPSTDSTARPGIVPASTGTPQAPVSEEAERESRRLRVGHTMVGVSMPPSVSQIGVDTGPSLRLPAPLSEEPVDLPTSGLPPWVIGSIVIGAGLLVVAAGLWLLR
jgi:protein phosphatase